MSQHGHHDGIDSQRFARLVVDRRHRSPRRRCRRLEEWSRSVARVSPTRGRAPDTYSRAARVTLRDDSIVTRFAWLEHFSLFHYMALAPAQHTDSATVVIVVALSQL